MAANFSTYMAKKILDNQLSDGIALPTHTTLYAALFHNSTGTTEDNLRANTAINEIADSGYEREALTITSGTSFSGAVSGANGSVSTSIVHIVFNTAILAYPNSVTHVALFDALTNGNVILYSSLSSSIAVAQGKNVRVNSGAFTVTL